MCVDAVQFILCFTSKNDLPVSANAFTVVNGLGGTLPTNIFQLTHERLLTNRYITLQQIYLLTRYNLTMYF